MRSTAKRLALAVILVTTASLGATATVASPAAAAAATAPTLSAPTMRTGYGTVTLRGTAPAGAKVVLYESAISINDMQPADDWEHGGGILTVTANHRGQFKIIRYVDTGFLFAVKSGGHLSTRRKVLVKVLPTLQLSSSEAGTVLVHAEASPNEDGLHVRISRLDADGRWVTVAAGTTDKVGAYSHRLTDQGAGTSQAYRVFIAGDPSNGVLANQSGALRVHVN